MISTGDQIEKNLPLPEPDAKRLTIEQYNVELDAAEAHMDAGYSISQDDAEKLAETWF